MALPGVKEIITDTFTCDFSFAKKERTPLRHLVLGSEGLIGRYVCDQIEKQGDELTRWDIKLDERHDLTKVAHPSRMAQFHEAVDAADFVHFLAYDVGGSRYLANKQNTYEYINNNTRIMDNVFLLLRQYEKPFYFASSQMSNMHDSVYGRLKAVGEAYTSAIGGVNVQFWNVYGYETDPEKGHVITDLIKQGLAEGRILCRTNGEETRHFTHANMAAGMLCNVATAFEAIMERNTTKGPIPIAAGRWVSIKDVANLIGKELDVPVYFSEAQDKTQSFKNDIPWNDIHADLVSAVRPRKTGLVGDERHPYYIEHGIKELIELYKKEFQPA